MKIGSKSIDYSKVAEIEISYSSHINIEDRIKITSSEDAANIFSNVFKDTIEHHERMYCMFLNRANEVLGIKLISVGGLSGTVCDPKVVFQTALKANASSIILCHNHPSGNIKASTNDIKLTNKIIKIGELLALPLLDHILMGYGKQYHSFLDNGEM